MKKVTISPANVKAIAFFEEIVRKKEELRKKIESKLEEAVVLKGKSTKVFQ